MEKVVFSINNPGKIGYTYFFKSRCIIDLNLKPQTMKALEENIGKNLCKSKLSRDFLNTTLKPQYSK